MTTDSPNQANEDRLRPHPQNRFAEGQINVDFSEVVARLRSEPSAGERGHRQETLYKCAGATVALFTFDHFTNLPEHKASGVVQIQVLRGKFKITADQKIYEMTAGQMLVLAPKTPHAVAAEEEGEILVTVLLS